MSREGYLTVALRCFRPGMQARIPLPFRALMQKPASIVFDTRQLNTFRLCQSMSATRERTPRRMGM